MSEHESFEERMRAIADQITRSMQRMADVDLEQLAESYGVDVEHARSVANAAGQWLNDHLSSVEPLFGEDRGDEPDVTAPRPEEDVVAGPGPGRRSAHAGPHPLDRATDRQGLALSALDSGRWTVRPGSNQLAGTGEGSPPPDGASDLVGDLRARDWITAEGGLTLVGRHALARWCRAAEDPADAAPASHAPRP